MTSHVRAMTGIGLFLQACALTAAAAPPAVIGTVMASGWFRLDDATVEGNATVLEGTLLETGAQSSLVDLYSGARLLVAAASKGRLFGDRLELEQGESRLENAAKLRLQARGWTILATSGGASGQVALAGAGRVRVSAFRGSFRVLNAHGVAVANVAEGAALELDPPLEAPPPEADVVSRPVAAPAGRGGAVTQPASGVNRAALFGGASAASFGGLAAAHRLPWWRRHRPPISR
jgi:hypothetical protein